MINKIQVHNFKCFGSPKVFMFSKLNLLTGVNGRGKSSLLQILLLMSQSLRDNDNLDKIVLNGDLVELGTFDDVKNSESPSSEDLDFIFYTDKRLAFKIACIEDKNEPLQARGRIWDYCSPPILALPSAKTEVQRLVTLLNSILKNIHYVSADRLGPVKYVEKSALPEFVNVGSRGENTINILANSMNLANVNELLYRGNDANSLIQQTEEWLGYILDGAKIVIKGGDKDSSVLYMLMNNKPNRYGYKPTNVGYGYSYILPLIVTGLIAKPGEIVIVENPEAHLHPQAQSRIAEFFARLASCGIQVFIESHSEHILNGLRISALDPEVEVSHEDLSIHYFNESFASENLVVDAKGKIANWPNGFFDQQEIDLASIFKLSR